MYISKIKFQKSDNITDLSPSLFSLYSEKIMSTVQDLGGVQIGDMNINNLRYADDTALIPDSNKNYRRF